MVAETVFKTSAQTGDVSRFETAFDWQDIANAYIAGECVVVHIPASEETHAYRFYRDEYLRLTFYSPPFEMEEHVNSRFRLAVWSDFTTAELPNGKLGIYFSTIK